MAIESRAEKINEFAITKQISLRLIALKLLNKLITTYTKNTIIVDKIENRNLSRYVHFNNLNVYDIVKISSSIYLVQLRQ